MSGFIVMQRAALDHPLLKDGERFRAWFWLCANACWRPTLVDVGGQIIELQRGQLCFSIRYMADAWGWSKSTVDRFLHRLEAESMLSLTRSKTGTAGGTGQLLITICNYEKYQSIGEQSGTPDGTAAGQQRDSSGTNKNKDNKGTRKREGDSPPSDTPPSDEVAILVNTWNEVCDLANLRRCVSVDDTRRRKAALRIKELGLEEMQECCARAGLSKFLTGHNDRNYRAGIEIILEPAKLTKLREGMYDDDAPRSRAPEPRRNRSDLRTNAIIDQVAKGLRA